MDKRDVLETLAERVELQSEAVKDCAESVTQDNPDLSKSQAFAICQDMENQGELGGVSFDVTLQEEDPCWDGYVMVGMKEENGREVPNCVPEEDADPADLAAECPEGQYLINDECISVEGSDAPPSVLNSEPRIMAAGRMDMDPIEREELSDGEVAFRNIKLLEAGVWTDSNSGTPTLYNEETFDNLNADSGEYDGPPVNIAHDVDSNGDPNEASLGGYVAPDSLRASDDALYGDLIVDTSKPAGAFADENLTSALESKGEVGFSPSVEIDPNGEMELATDHPRAEHHATGGLLTGLGLVSDPASKPVDFAQQTRQRAVAMSGQSDKAVYMQRTGMDVDNLREILEDAGVPGLEDMTDDDVVDMAESMHGDLMDELATDEDMGDYMEADEDEEEDEEEMDMEEGDDMDEGEEEEEDEEEMEMQDEAFEAMREEMDDLWETVDMLKERMIEEDMMEQKADAETVEELRDAKDELETRLAELENEEEEPRTMAEGSPSSEWANAGGRVTDNSNSL